MNKLKLGSRVFTILSSDGKAKPDNITLKEIGTVSNLTNTEEMRVVGWGHTMIFESTEGEFLKPSSDGFCYYMAEPPNIDSYYENGFFKVPAITLKEHMATYESPWE